MKLAVAQRLPVGTGVFCERTNDNGWWWTDYSATILKVGQARVRIAFDDREAWVTPGRLHLSRSVPL